MIVLAIETSGGVGSVALAEGERILAEEVFEKGLRHGERLIPAIDGCLGRAGLDRRAIDLFAAGTGPGSYTGLRIGVVTAKALAFALKRPAVGVASFDALAADLSPESLAGASTIVVAADARRDRLYLGYYGADRARRGGFEVRAAERLLEGAAEPAVLAGSGLERYPALTARARFVEAHPLARTIARLAPAAHRARPEATLHELAPLYLTAGVAAADPREAHGRG